MIRWNVSDRRQLPFPARTHVPNDTAPQSEVSQPPDICVLVDYDGTLVPIAQAPQLAAPDKDVLALLEALAVRRGLRLEVVSGRTHLDLDQWLGHLPIALWAEHGFWHRPRRGESWTAGSSVPDDRMPMILPIVSEIAASTPGSHVECKTAAIAWHYRLADPTLAARQIRVLRARLDNEACDQPVDVLAGKKVVEVRLRGISKALVAERIVADVPAGSLIVAIGDDRTDEELFSALPRSSVTVAVGNQPSSAKYRVADYRAVRRMLRSILEDPRGVMTSIHNSF
jgi:trehalose 6-phosphate synthase/phosphatase